MSANARFRRPSPAAGIGEADPAPRKLAEAISRKDQAVPRISRLNRSQVSESTTAIYDRYLRQRGNVPNMFRTVAHRPAILETMIAHMEAVLNTGTLSTKLKELVIARTSQLNNCDYCLASHSAICRRLGWSQDLLDHLTDFENRDDLTAAEKAALRLAARMTLDSKNFSDEEFAQLRSYYSEGEVVELMAAIGLFNYFNRFNNLLQMEPTKPGEGVDPAMKVASQPEPVIS
jgi:uncharacterized peroxidase-related enzyme